MKTIEEYCDKYRACKEGRDWALANCQTMQDVWDTCKRSDLIWIAKKSCSTLELQKFALFCANQVRHLMKDERSIQCLDANSKFLNGEITKEEFYIFRNAAAAAAYAAAYVAAAAYAAAAADADTAYAAAYASDATATAAADAAAAAADAADTDTADTRKEIYTKQCEWLRQNTKPIFE